MYTWICRYYLLSFKSVNVNALKNVFNLFLKNAQSILPIFHFFLAFNFSVGSAWSFCFFIPATMSNDLWLRRIFYPRSYPLQYFLILILEKEPVFPFSVLSAKQGNYWYQFYNVGIEPLALEANTSRRRCLPSNQCYCSWTYNWSSQFVYPSEIRTLFVTKLKAYENKVREVFPFCACVYCSYCLQRTIQETEEYKTHTSTK